MDRLSWLKETSRRPEHALGPTPSMSSGRGAQVFYCHGSVCLAQNRRPNRTQRVVPRACGLRRDLCDYGL